MDSHPQLKIQLALGTIPVLNYVDIRGPTQFKPILLKGELYLSYKNVDILKTSLSQDINNLLYLGCIRLVPWLHLFLMILLDAKVVLWANARGTQVSTLKHLCI